MKQTNPLFYTLVKVFVRLALKIFVRKQIIYNSVCLQLDGPTLITSNHPNSFLDAIIIGAQFRRPVHFLARGDAFNKPWHSKLLSLLKMIPIYRLSEGKENLALNGFAFKKSREVLDNGGILLIFIEGICVNSHEMQPFKKGAVRIAIDCKNIPGIQILPVGIAYDSFTKFGKEVVIDFGIPITVKELLPFDDEIQNMRNMNVILHEQMQRLIHIPIISPEEKNRNIKNPVASIGKLLHWPLYSFLRNFIKDKTAGTVFFDSVLFGVLLVAYPVYLLALATVLCIFNLPGTIIFFIILAHPLLAWYTVQESA